MLRPVRSCPRLAFDAVAIVAVALVSLGARRPAHATIINFTASIDGSQETPPCSSGGSGVASSDTGLGTFVMDTCANTLSFNVTFTGLSCAPESAAHIHGFAPAGVPAGILFALPGGSPKVGMWSFLESQEANIVGGLTYVNIHGTTCCTGGEIRGQILQDAGQPTPGPCPTVTPTPTLTATPVTTPTPTETATPAIDHYVLYKAKAPKDDAAPLMNKFPAHDYNLLLDDVTLANGEPDDPENYQVKKEKSLAVPAMKNDEAGPSDPALHYIRYQIKEAKEGAGAFDTAAGKYPKAVKHKPRIWSLVNQFGTVKVLSKKVEALLVPAAKDPSTPGPADPGDHTHYLCYQAKVTKDVTGQTPDPGNGVGKLRKDLEAYFGDQFLNADCALDRDGNPSFPASTVAGKCLFDLKKIKFLCNPVAKADVGGTPARVTVAPPGSTSTPSTTDSLLCYQVKLSSKVLSQAAATLGGVSVGDVLKQSKHVKRSPFTTPGNQFPVPVRLDTIKTEFACLPTLVTSVVDAP
jgi:CHRD domain